MEESHYKRMLKRILEVFEDYKKGKCQSSAVIWTTLGNIGALDGLTNKFEDITYGFTGSIAALKEDKVTLENVDDPDFWNAPDTEEDRKQIIEYIEEYEPYIHELLKIDR